MTLRSSSSSGSLGVPLKKLQIERVDAHIKRAHPGGKWPAWPEKRRHARVASNVRMVQRAGTKTVAGAMGQPAYKCKHRLRVRNQQAVSEGGVAQVHGWGGMQLGQGVADQPG